MFNSRDTLFGKKDDPKAGHLAQTRVGGAAGGNSVKHEAASHAAAPAADAAPSAIPSQPAASAAASTSSSGSRLIVGPDIKLKGVEITDCDTLVVEGRVEASMDSRVIQIAENGVYMGTVGIDIAEIRGRFEGELTARKQLIIHSTGRVIGKIRYGKITVEDGGELNGDITTLNHAPTERPAGEAVDIMKPYDPFAQKGKAAATRNSAASA